MKKLILFLTIIFALFGSCFIPSHAHPVPVAVQEFKINFSKEKVDFTYDIFLDPQVIDIIYPIIDKDNNGKISDVEADSFSQEVVIKNLNGRLNSKDLILDKISYKAIDKSLIKGFDKVIEISYSLESPKLLDTNTFVISYNKKFVPNDQWGDQTDFKTNLSDSSDYSIISSKSDISNKTEYSVDFTAREKQPILVSNNAIEKNWVQKLFSNISHKSKELTNSIFNSQRTGFIFFIIGLFIAFIAGALHAFTPGHGKSMMAAFLVGKNKSGFIDVFILGAAITLAHTIVIFILGFVFLGLNNKFSLNNILPYFEKISSLLLVFLTFNLIKNGYKNYTHLKDHEKEIEHSHHHHHSSEDINIKSKYSLFLAGLGGGIIPCADALSLLILSVSLGKTGYGLVLILSFSLGLALTIVSLGLLLVLGKNKFNLENRFNKAASIYAPLLSGIVILLIALRFLI